MAEPRAAEAAPEAGGGAPGPNPPKRMKLDLTNPEHMEIFRQSQYKSGLAALSEGNVTKAAAHLAVFYHLIQDPQEKTAIVQGWKSHLTPEVFYAIANEITRLEATALVELGLAEEIALTMISMTVSYTCALPFEVAKLLLQTQPELTRRGVLMPWESFAGPIDCFRRRIFSTAAFGPLWKANFLGVALVAPRQLLSKACDVVAGFGPLQAIAPAALQATGSFPRCGVFFRYLIPGYLSQFLTHPLQVARTRLACGQTGGSGPFYASFSSMYAVFNSAVMIQTALTWHELQESRKTEQREFELEKAYPVTAQIGLTVTKDILGALTVFPVDLVRRRMMLAPAESPYSSFGACASAIYSKEGVGGFFNGWSMCVMQTAVGSVAIALVSGPLRRLYISYRTQQKEVEMKQARIKMHNSKMAQQKLQ
eukprot:m.459571 g.459571  ORF g.459571 m.459571 type:complete len:424 (+) comp21786_c0_seq1:22-1293(+)